jgi:hypothetical protein
MTQITETTQTTHHAETVTLTGAPLHDLQARAHEIWEARDGFRWRYFLSRIGGEPTIQMEFSKGGDA